MFGVVVILSFVKTTEKIKLISKKTTKGLFPMGPKEAQPGLWLVQAPGSNYALRPEPRLRPFLVKFSPSTSGSEGHGGAMGHGGD